MKILIVVDMQHDFIDGPLGTKEARTIVPKVKKLISNLSEGDFIIFTQDTHTEDYLCTQEGKKLPVKHCIEGTHGWEILEELMDAAFKGKAVAYVMEKYSFGAPDIASHIDYITQNTPIDEIIFCGVCTDICVVSNALIIKSAFPDTPVTIIEDACAGTTPENHDAAIRVMQNCQCNIMEETI